jgi:hypothetical protein
VPIAAALLVVQGILGLVGLAVSFTLRDVLSDKPMTADAIAAQLAGGAPNMSVFGVGFAVLLSVSCLVLAVFVLRGSNRARIAAWVFSGLGLLGFGLSAVSFAPSAAKRPVPHWYLEYSGAVSLLVLVIYAAIVVLVLRPSTSDYFARRPA